MFTPFVVLASFNFICGFLELVLSRVAVHVCVPAKDEKAYGKVHVYLYSFLYLL